MYVKTQKTIFGDAGIPETITISRDGKRAALSKYWGRVVICDASSEEPVLPLNGGDNSETVRPVCFSVDGGCVAFGGRDDRVVIWDASSGKQVRALEGGHTEQRVVSVCFSADGGRVASGGDDGRVVIWDASSGEQVHALEGGHGWREVYSVCFSGDGGRVASGGSDGRVVIWDISSENHLEWNSLHALENGHSSQIVSSVCFSHNGERVASGADNAGVVIWDAKSGKKLQAIDTPLRRVGVTFLGDTNDICVGLFRFSPYLFCLETWREIRYKLNKSQPQASGLKRPRLGNDSLPVEVFKDVFDRLLEPQSQMNLAIADKFVWKQTKAYIVTSKKVVFVSQDKNGHWYVDESGTRLPKEVYATAASAAPADGADGGGAALQLQRLRL